MSDILWISSVDLDVEAETPYKLPNPHSETPASQFSMHSFGVFFIQVAD
jgi:hypothetical protein